MATLPGMIECLVRPSDESWDRCCRTDSTSTFFQTRHWARVCSAMGAGWRDTSIEVVFRDGVRALVPRLSRPVARGLFRQLEASPPGVYGAPLVKGEGLSRDQWRAISRLFDRHVVDHYRTALGDIRKNGFYATLAESSGPYIEAVWTNFSSDKPTITEDILSGKLIGKAAQGIGRWLGLAAEDAPDASARGPSDK